MAVVEWAEAVRQRTGDVNHEKRKKGDGETGSRRAVAMEQEERDGL